MPFVSYSQESYKVLVLVGPRELSVEGCPPYYAGVALRTGLTVFNIDI